MVLSGCIFCSVLISLRIFVRSSIKINPKREVPRWHCQQKLQEDEGHESLRAQHISNWMQGHQKQQHKVSPKYTWADATALSCCCIREFRARDIHVLLQCLAHAQPIYRCTLCRDIDQNASCCTRTNELGGTAECRSAPEFASLRKRRLWRRLLSIMHSMCCVSFSGIPFRI